MYTAPTHNIQVQSQRPQGFTPQQTQGAYNFQKAQAHASSDPRMHMKGFDRAGFSRGKGQQGYAAASSAQAYGQGNAAAEGIGLQDAASNANLGLQYDASRDQQGLALARLQEQMRNQQSMFGIQRQANAMGLAGNIFGGVMNSLGGGGNLLTGLLS
jgi:hypothetical protein